MEQEMKHGRSRERIFVLLLCGLALIAWLGTAEANGDGIWPPGNRNTGFAPAQSQKRLLEITYDNKAKQVVPLDQPAGNVSMMVFKSGSGAAASQDSQQTALTKGWDIFNEPLSVGQVEWTVADGQRANNLQVAVQLSGAKPNHEFTVGVHLFNPTNPTARPNVKGFGGWDVGGGGVISRDGRSAYGIAYDFGGLKTNAGGDGFAQFNLTVPPGTYSLQFTVRIGAVNTCRPSQGATGGCSVVYRSGKRFGEGLETISIPSY